MTQLSRSYLLPAGDTRLENAMLPFKVLAEDSGGAISICEFVLPAWSSGPVLHRHDGVDEGFYVVSGRLEFQLDDARKPAQAGDFAWVPRGTAHTFACAGDDPVHVVAFACPGGIEHLSPSSMLTFPIWMDLQTRRFWTRWACATVLRR